MKIMTEALVDAPIGTVWRTFNDPADIVLWDASDDWRTTWASNDLRVGGLLRLRIEPRHGDTGFDFTATYNKLEPMRVIRSEEHTSEIQSLMRISYDVFCMDKTQV